MRLPWEKEEREGRSPARELFETRSEIWQEAGLGEQLEPGAKHRAWASLTIATVLIALVLVAYHNRGNLFPDYGTETRIATVAALLILGWWAARSIGRSIAPALYRRLDPGTAGTLGFLTRLLTIVVMSVVALRIAGLDPRAIAVGGAFTAVVVGLAAQQTIGNLIAGVVLQSTRPFKVGERVRLLGGGVAGEIEGTVASLGLFYATLVSGADRLLVPNGVLITLVVVPLREPDKVDFRARFDIDTSPRQVQERLREAISVPTRYPPDVTLEEMEHDSMVLRVSATPLKTGDGPQLAEDVLESLRAQARSPA
jgi:small conductance mechanosensitive channel